MDKINIEKINESYIRINSNYGIEQELSDYVTFDVPGAKFMKSFKAKLWDGKIRLFNLKTHLLYAGLLDHVKKFAQHHGYEINYVNQCEEHTPLDRIKVEAWIKSLNIHVRGKPAEVYDYQIDAVMEAIQNHRQILLSPTASGKSLIIYILFRWLLKFNNTCLLIVPTVALVDQMFSDFAEYSSAVDWNPEDYCQKIYAGMDKNITKPITISTWQSIYKLDANHFKKYDAVIGDEAHLYKAESIVGIMEKSVNAKYRIGTTGTLDKSLTSKLVLQGIFGPVYKVITTRELIDSGRASELKIKVLKLNYNEEIRKVVSKYKYDKEYEYVITNQNRNIFISKLALSTQGNTLILVDLVEKHAKPLVDIITSIAGDRKVFSAFGGADIEDIRRIVSNEKDAIIVASYKKMSTGTNIPSIENIIFGSPSKSIVRILQSIGRGLRLNVGKANCKLFDLIDDLSWKSKKNTILGHGTERLHIYSEQKFEYSITEVNLK